MNAEKDHQPEDHSSPLKRLLKAITTPAMRSAIKRNIFRLYCCRQRGLTAPGRKDFPDGVNLLGRIRGDFGLGQSCRLVAYALQHSELPFSIRNIPLKGPANEGDLSWREYERKETPFNINLVHLNPPEIQTLVWTEKPSPIPANRYNIGFWLWELPEFPEQWNDVFLLFHEIWTPAEFISEAIRKNTVLPVYTVPYALPLPQTVEGCQRDFFGLPDERFLFLLSYDGNSVSERKNPMASLRAYCRAFSAEETGVGLVIKATHATQQELKELGAMLQGYPNVYFLTDSYGREEFNSLIACVDVYVSLHRAEGFGLVMAEAMLLETPVIATNWSANTEFMDESVACLVDAEVVALTEDCPPYEKGSHWAQPDEGQAARWMRKLYEDRAYAQAMAKRAKAHLQTVLSVERASCKIEDRVNKIYKEWETLTQRK